MAPHPLGHGCLAPACAQPTIIRHDELPHPPQEGYEGVGDRPDQGTVRLTLMRLQQLLDEKLDALARAPTPAAVHEGRIAARRLSVVLRALKRLLVPSVRHRYLAALKKIITDLEVVREADVRHDAIKALIGNGKHFDREHAQQMLVYNADIRKRSRRKLRRLMKNPRWKRRQRKLRLYAQQLLPIALSREPTGVTIRKIVNRRDRQLRKQLQHVGRTAKKLHSLRLRIKGMRYLIEALGPLPDKPVRTDQKQLRQLQNRLGQYHDNWDLQRWLTSQDQFQQIVPVVPHLLGVRQKQLRKAIDRAISPHLTHSRQ